MELLVGLTLDEDELDLVFLTEVVFDDLLPLELCVLSEDLRIIRVTFRPDVVVPDDPIL